MRFTVYISFLRPFVRETDDLMEAIAYLRIARTHAPSSDPFIRDNTTGEVMH